YAIHVPCPELSGHAEPLAATDPGLGEEGALVLDARSAAEFAAWHLPRARSLPYDYLEPVAPRELGAVVSSGASRVVVYGDGADPDSGQELAKEIAARGVRNVFYVEGGAPALRARPAP
ncbi:MAG: rhodanese-like domain-containing protein, partial [Deltaproteobacteria bacterium]|nr:rhodanese-like domain-containing protein [Deltaproteobacteria bacterium]